MSGEKLRSLISVPHESAAADWMMNSGRHFQPDLCGITGLANRRNVGTWSLGPWPTRASIQIYDVRIVPSGPDLHWRTRNLELRQRARTRRATRSVEGFSSTRAAPTSRTALAPIGPKAPTQLLRLDAVIENSSAMSSIRDGALCSLIAHRT